MNIKVFVFIAGVLLGLAACNQGTNPMVARKTPQDPNGKTGDENKKPEPLPGKLAEKFKALQLQRPTLNESEYLNAMELEFGDADRALFSFSYAPDEDGSLFFTLAQVRLHLSGCTKDEKRTAKIGVFWQEVQKNQRKVLDSLVGNVQEFQFRSGRQYLLSYVLMDLKKEFADCKSANLKFASFLKNYR